MLALSGPVAADPLRLAQSALPPHEILTSVRSTGLNPLGPPARRGPNYVLRATDVDGSEVRVVVDALRGEVLSVAPVETASRRLPPGYSMGPWEPMRPPGYIGPAPGAYESGPPVIYQEEPPSRPPGMIPGGRASDSIPSQRDTVTSAPLSEPQVITAPEQGGNGMLPPPPERFPQRVAPAPAAKPAPPRRSAAAVPARPPLPKPRPTAAVAAPAVAPPPEAAPQPAPEAAAAPPPASPPHDPADDSVPH